MANPLLRPIVTTVTVLALAASAADARPAGPAPSHTASEAIRAAVIARIGADADVVVDAVDVRSDAPGFREARPDPSARLGKPMRFTLITIDGVALPATAQVTVVQPHAVVRRTILRGHVVAADDIQAARAEVTNAPLSRLPTADEVTGARALRPMDAGTVVLRPFVALRRAVEMGDKVTVVALAGAIEVTATFIAADAGDVGDTIRVRNPDTKKFVRGRVVRAGVVEVRHDR